MPTNPEDLADYGQSVESFLAFADTTTTCCRTVTTVAADSTRGSRHISVASSLGITPGMQIILWMQNSSANGRLLGGLQPWPEWSSTNTDGIEIREKHRVESVLLETITLAEPVLVDVTAADGWEVWFDELSAGWGVQDLHLIGSGSRQFVHHGSWLDDSAFKMISFFRAVEPYVLRVRFTDVGAPVNFAASYRSTALLCSVEGNMGHASFSASYFSTFSLFAFNFDQNQWHGHGVSGGAAGTVITKSKVSDSGLDWHAKGPYATLTDACSGGLIGSGGHYRNLPNHLQHLTFWNFNQTSRKSDEPVDWWSPRECETCSLYAGPQVRLSGHCCVTAPSNPRIIAPSRHRTTALLLYYSLS